MELEFIKVKSVMNSFELKNEIPADYHIARLKIMRLPLKKSYKEELEEIRGKYIKLIKIKMNNFKNLNIFKMTKPIYYTFCVFFILFLIPGFVLWISGCNTKVVGGCVTKILKSAIVTESQVITGLCGYGSDCYHVYVSYMYGNNKTCHQSKEDHISMSDAERQLKEYPVGRELDIMVKPHWESCDDNVQKYYRMWYTGVIFLFIDVFILMLWFCDYMKSYIDTHIGLNKNTNTNYGTL